MEIKKIIKRILRENEEQKDLLMLKTIRRAIPDNSTYQMYYPLPYSDQGDVHVKMKFSVSPSTKILDLSLDEENFKAVQLDLDVSELLWKSDFDMDYEKVHTLNELPSIFVDEFEDEMSERLRKTMGIPYVDVNLRYEGRGLPKRA